MKTAFIRAVAIFIVICGAMLHCVSNFTLRRTATEAMADRVWTFNPVGGKIVQKEEWWPWAGITGGTVLFIWSFTIPKRGGGKPKEH